MKNIDGYLSKSLILLNASTNNYYSLILRLSTFTSILLLLSACGGGSGSSSQQPEPLSDNELLEYLNLSAPMAYNNRVASNREKRLQIEIEFANTVPFNENNLRINILIDSDGSGDVSTHDFFIQLDNPLPCASSHSCYSSKTESIIYGSYNETDAIYKTRFLSNLSYGATEETGNLKVILGLHIFTENEEKLLMAGNSRYLVNAILADNLEPGTDFQSTTLSSDSYPDNGYILISDRYELDIEQDYGGNDSSADIRAIRVTNLLDDIQ